MVKILAAIFFFALQHPIDAQLTILHSFGDGSVTNDGAVPQAGLIQAQNGDFYGVTTNQAEQLTAAAGTVFRMTRAGKVSVIHHFGLTSNLWSNSPLLYYQGKLIGVTPSGPSSTGTGTLFALSKSASTGKWRLNFWQKNIGLEGNVILSSDGNFYGVSLLDVLKISATTHEVTTVFNRGANLTTFSRRALLKVAMAISTGSTKYLQGLQYQWGAIF